MKIFGRDLEDFSEPLVVEEPEIKEIAEIEEDKYVPEEPLDDPYKNGPDIETMRDYSKNVGIFYDNMVVDSWRKEVNHYLSKKNVCAISENSSLIETLLTDEDYRPFLKRVASIKHAHKRHKGKIFVNGKNKTKELLIRKDALVEWIKNADDPGALYAAVPGIYPNEL